MLNAYLLFVGFCTEYSYGGNIIQQNIRTNCTTFSQNPCPDGYLSTDSYKCKYVMYCDILYVL